MHDSGKHVTAIVETNKASEISENDYQALNMPSPQNKKLG